VTRNKTKPSLGLFISCKGALLASCFAVLYGGYAAAHDPIGKVTWDREIAPIVQARCVSCHSAGGKAPMALTTYEEVRPWARAIREEVLARRMPKWPIVRGYGDFANDRSLSPFEIKLITAWVDGGAPRTLPKTAAPPPTALPAAPRLPPRFAAPAKTRTMTIPCTAQRLPAGTILGFEPLLDQGGSLRAVVERDGLEEPLFWLKDFDPQTADIYWLRTPLDSAKTSRLHLNPTGSQCDVTVVLAARTGR
jgi:hypothetical protein